MSRTQTLKPEVWAKRNGCSFYHCTEQRCKSEMGFKWEGGDGQKEKNSAKIMTVWSKQCWLECLIMITTIWVIISKLNRSIKSTSAIIKQLKLLLMYRRSCHRLFRAKFLYPWDHSLASLHAITPHICAVLERRQPITAICLFREGFTVFYC